MQFTNSEYEFTNIYNGFTIVNLTKGGGNLQIKEFELKFFLQFVRNRSCGGQLHVRRKMLYKTVKNDRLHFFNLLFNINKLLGN